MGAELLDFEIAKNSPNWAKRLCVFDLETTGLDLTQARIVTACVAIINAHGEIESEPQEWLVNPGIEIPAEAAAVHGISTQIAQDQGISPEMAIREINQALASASAEGIPLVAFNAPYDFTILKHESIRHGLGPIEPRPVIDPLVLDRKVNKFRKGKRTLSVLCADFGVSLIAAHNSTADAIAAGRLAQTMAAKYPELDLPAQELHDNQVMWSDEQSLDFANFMRTRQPEFQAELGWPVKLT